MRFILVFSRVSGTISKTHTTLASKKTGVYSEILKSQDFFLLFQKKMVKFVWSSGKVSLVYN